jgi:hypothetical protein
MDRPDAPAPSPAPSPAPAPAANESARADGGHESGLRALLRDPVLLCCACGCLLPLCLAPVAPSGGFPRGVSAAVGAAATVGFVDVAAVGGVWCAERVVSALEERRKGKDTEDAGDSWALAGACTAAGAAVGGLVALAVVLAGALQRVSTGA